MSTKLYVKNPNNVQKIIDVDKIFTTDGGTMTGDINFKISDTSIGEHSIVDATVGSSDMICFRIMKYFDSNRDLVGVFSRKTSDHSVGILIGDEAYYSEWARVVRPNHSDTILGTLAYPWKALYVGEDGVNTFGDIYFTTINNKTLKFEIEGKNPDEASTYYRRGMNIGWDYNNKDGSGFFVRANDWPGTEAGAFGAYACDGTNIAKFVGRPNGSLTWKGWEILQVGIIQAFAGSNTPAGWLLCDGSAISRTTYDRLFSIIGTKYGAGDGSTTFNLPNLTDKFIEGSGTVGTVKNAGLPNINGWFTLSTQYGHTLAFSINNSGAIYPATHDIDSTVITSSSTVSNSSNLPRTLTFNASHSSSIYGNSTTVQPPALTMRYIIKY